MKPIRKLFSRQNLRQLGPGLITGVIAVPIMAVMMLLASRADIMGSHVIGPRLRWLGWIATAAMAATVIAMFTTIRRRLPMISTRPFKPADRSPLPGDDAK